MFLSRTVGREQRRRRTGKSRTEVGASLFIYELFLAGHDVNTALVLICESQDLEVRVRLGDFLEPLVACPARLQRVHILNGVNQISLAIRAQETSPSVMSLTSNC